MKTQLTEEQLKDAIAIRAAIEKNDNTSKSIEKLLADIENVQLVNMAIMGGDGVTSLMFLSDPAKRVLLEAALTAAKLNNEELRKQLDTFDFVIVTKD